MGWNLPYRALVQKAKKAVSARLSEENTNLCVPSSSTPFLRCSVEVGRLDNLLLIIYPE
jgi:hypothetical protein